MPKFPVGLKSERIELRALDATLPNAEMVYKVIDRNRDYLLPWLPLWASRDRIKSPKDILDFLEDCQKERAAGDACDFGIFAGGEYIGNVGVFDISDKNKSCALEYWICKDFAKKGYMTEAIKLVENMLFGTQGLNRIEIKCDTRNAPSESLARRLGYTFEGTARSGAVNEIENIFISNHIFSKLHDEWEDQQ